MIMCFPEIESDHQYGLKTFSRYPMYDQEQAKSLI